MTVGGIKFDPQELMSKDELISFLRETGSDNRALSNIRDRQHEKYGNELMWNYTISDGVHLGTFIVPVKEGFVSLPYDAIDNEDGELLELDEAAMFDCDAMQFLIDDWRSFSDGLTNAMTDMLHILRGE